MSGETEGTVNGWTLWTLHNHLRALMLEADQRNEQRFEGQEKAVAAALAAQEKAVAAALAAADRAVSKAEGAAEKRLDSVNEFRDQLRDQATTFMPRLESEQRMRANLEKISALEQRMNENFVVVNSRLDLTQGRSGGLNAGFGYLVAAVSLLATVLAIAYAVSK